MIQKKGLAGAWETRTIGSEIRDKPLKPDDRPEMTKEYAG